MNKKFITQTEAGELIKSFGAEFTVIQNPSYIFPPVELCPLAKPIYGPINNITAVVMDMDGTTTTTEEICIHALEFMVRKITNRMDKKTWKGLDHEKDFPHIIGNSTTKHVEYLIRTYENEIKKEYLHSSYFFAVLWTLLIGKDESRKTEVKNNLNSLGLGGFLTSRIYHQLKVRTISHDELIIITNKLCKKFKNKIIINTFSDIVRVAIDIYYQRYHEILFDITMGKSKQLVQELLSDKSKHLIAPLPGVGLFLALVKGLLGDEVLNLSNEFLLQFYQKKPSSSEVFNRKLIDKKLLKLSRIFEKKPLKVGVVTSSIFYEADIVLGEVFRVLNEEISAWNISKARKKKILKHFCNYNQFYDTVVTASNANEIRLKPHRDLYSIALHQLAIPKKDFDKVIGFEDSESGTTAIRTAGIGNCVAVPFAQTSGHNFGAATCIAYNGFMEVVLKHSLFLKL